MTNNMGRNQGLDSQAAAGALLAVFAGDVTTASAVCAGCGREGPFAEMRLYGGEIGVVIRCPECDHLLLRLVETPRGAWLEMQGVRRLMFPNETLPEQHAEAGR
jgi:DNA-directed RNA polymerase subunit RPC12/RpoP